MRDGFPCGDQGWRLKSAHHERLRIAPRTKWLLLNTPNNPTGSGYSRNDPAALTGPQTILQERRDSFRRRRDLVVDALNAIDGLSCIRPEGTFFAYPSCGGLVGKRAPDGRVMESDQDFAAYLLESAGVATVPGTAFGRSPHFRVSFASSTELLEEACERIGRACAALR